MTIVSISVDYSNARQVCNQIENQVFKSFTELRGYLNNNLISDEEVENKPQFFSLTDFMEECNDQYFDFEGTFISYVKVESL